MKNVLFVLLASVAAQATTLKCVVPQEGAAPAITAVIEAVEESQGDFMTLTITQPEGSLLYFNQLDKGAFKQGLAEGSLVSLVVSESASMVNGALKGAGFLVLQKEGATFSGFASLNDTFYPLACQE
jgi:hypothetical protein